ncbi:MULTISPECIES: SDR family NAD(P)-dependent oxidoreductase [unclassified Dietzia]|uniref:SDR family NAD(P)-dependent oxidoreductase n=1 Tax=unclassified Dietzia TaxID=2617939 RepID=UPI0015FD5739|nr:MULTISPECIES: SDR family NAD(P)-dependent oxidoreductase [unclassified Dietzia]MBB1023939.1 SDR family NAD(P)-dependent oxidoreductase [Dietzia sp. DQ12-76]MBB1026401.1 SDR family NAD(P)-dependent oxidoreductase [Dietzia sp. DQ11-38-2]
MTSASASDTPVVVITGAGGGLGAATAALYAARGWHVVAADLTPPVGGEGLTPVAVDVTDPVSLRALADRVRADHGRLDALITFAGVLGIGPLAETDPDRVQQVLDVNVMGTVRTVHAMFDLLRVTGGRVVLISSETGPQHGMPMNGAYAMSKHAIEAYGDSLRRELMFLGLDVVLVQPGPFRTGMTASIRRRFQESTLPGSPFAAMAAVIGEMAAGEDDKAADPRLLAEAVWTAGTTARPRHRYAVRWDLGRRLLDLLPVPVVDRALRAALRGRIDAARLEMGREASDGPSVADAEVRS